MRLWYNGLKSIDAHIGKDYLRIRVGIGKSGNVSSYVLDNFSRQEAESMEIIIQWLAKHLFAKIREFYRIGARNLKIDHILSNHPAVTAVSAKKVT